MTTTTPESRARIAWTAYGRRMSFVDRHGRALPSFDELPTQEREAWIAAAGVIWELGTTGRATIGPMGG
jgi:hypothetical protein